MSADTHQEVRHHGENQQNPAASGNLNGNNGSARPDSVDMVEAMALMADAGDDEAEETASADEEEGDDATAEDDGDEVETAEEAADEEAEAAAEDAEAPEFWSADDKTAWESVPAALRPMLKKYEQQRVEFVNEKAREAAQVRTQAAQDVERANATIVQAAQWWRQAGPALQQAFASKWATVDWKSLAEKDPAEYARLDQERQKDQARSSRRGKSPPVQEDTRAATERAPCRPLSKPSTPRTPSSRSGCPNFSAARRRRRRPTARSPSSCSPRASRPTASTRSMRPRSSKWRSTPCDSSRPRRKLRLS